MAEENLLIFDNAFKIIEFWDAYTSKSSIHEIPVYTPFSHDFNINTPVIIFIEKQINQAGRHKNAE